MSDSPCIIDIGAIIGGEESNRLVELLMAMVTAWAERQGLLVAVLETQPAFGAGFETAKLRVEGSDAAVLAELLQGVHSLIRVPPEDAFQRRHMSAAGLRVSTELAAPLPEKWGAERLRYVLEPEPYVVHPKLGRLRLDPNVLWAGDFSALSTTPTTSRP